MKTGPLVSIIIPTFNRYHILGATLNSVLEQTYRNWECLVVDDGSMDYTEELMDFFCFSDSRIKYVIRPETNSKGANSCRNLGFSLSKGEFIQWLDDDDTLLVEFLEKKLKAFKPDTQFVICGGYFADENMKRIGVMKLENKFDIFKDVVLWNQHVITDSVLFRRSFLSGKELFYPPLERGQEAEFFARMFFNISSEFCEIVIEPLFLYRQHSDTKTFQNRGYVKTFKENQTFIAIENLKRGIILEDKDLIFYYYDLLINYFFLGLENNHKNNSITIFNSLRELLKKRNRKVACKFYFFGNLSLVSNREFHRFRRSLKSLVKHV